MPNFKYFEVPPVLRLKFTFISFTDSFKFYIFAPRKKNGLVVQRIEWEFPKLLIQVRFLARLQKAVQQCAAFLFMTQLIE